MVQFSDEILNTFVAPRLSEITCCGARPLAQLPDYLSDAILGHIFGLRYEQPAQLHLSMTFLKRSMAAADEYRAGRECLIRYISARTSRDHDLRAYLRGLSHFEQSIGAIAQCIELFHKMNELCVPFHPLPFQTGDGSDLERICRLNNTAKHFHAGQAERASAPVWITNTGLSSGGVTVSFNELRQNIEALSEANRVMFIEIPRQRISRIEPSTR